MPDYTWRLLLSTFFHTFSTFSCCVLLNFSYRHFFWQTTSLICQTCHLFFTYHSHLHISKCSRHDRERQNEQFSKSSWNNPRCPEIDFSCWYRFFDWATCLPFYHIGGSTKAPGGQIKVKYGTLREIPVCKLHVDLVLVYIFSRC